MPAADLWAARACLRKSLVHGLRGTDNLLHGCAGPALDQQHCVVVDPLSLKVIGWVGHADRGKVGHGLHME